MNHASRGSAAPTEVKTFCRICTSMCGVIATVENGQITGMKTNSDHVISGGYFCKKAQGAVDVTYDPDRVIYPMKRTGGPGEFTRISWQQAYSEIAGRLKAIRNTHGPEAFATYLGNPPYYSYSAWFALSGFNTALDVKWKYGVNGEDANAMMAAAGYLYGSIGRTTKPDLAKTSFFLNVGANPIGSHGGGEPHMRKALKAIVKRGGRVVVVDPRRTETAELFEHIPIRAGSDAWFLTALLRELIHQGYADRDFIASHTRGFEQLRAALEPCTPEWAERHSGIPAQTIRDLARDFGSADGASVRGRTGTCTQRYGTFSTMLLDMLTIVTGNLDRPGGQSFGLGLVDLRAIMAGNPGGPVASRTTSMPEIGGQLPSSALVTDITTPGQGQVRALLLHGANPCLNSVAAGPAYEEALQSLDLLFSIDIYVNESNRYADYILPGATMWEHDDVPVLIMTGMMQSPGAYATPPVVDKAGEAREDWEILYELCRRLGAGAALPKPWMRNLARIGITIKPHHILNHIIRTGRFGDRYGLRPGGLSIKKLIRNYPDGIKLMDGLPFGIIGQSLMTADKRINLASPQILSEIQRVLADDYYLDPAYPLRLHSMREVLTHNSWMHNARSLARSDQGHSARIHPDDALRHGISDGDPIRIQSPYGEVDTVARTTDKMTPGNIALPHGWGHQGGWKLANGRGGVNANLLSSNSPADTDQIGASSILNGIPVNIRRLA